MIQQLLSCSTWLLNRCTVNLLQGSILSRSLHAALTGANDLAINLLFHQHIYANCNFIHYFQLKELLTFTLYALCHESIRSDKLVQWHNSWLYPYNTQCLICTGSSPNWGVHSFNWKWGWLAWICNWKG